MRAVLGVVAVVAAITVGYTVADGASPSPYEQVRAARAQLTTAKTALVAADTELAAAEASLKPAEQPKTEQAVWAPASTTQVPASDQTAAAAVVVKPEVHADNTPFNAYIPAAAELEAFHKAAAGFSPLSKYVDGLDGIANPSTDDLIQWAAVKWGVPAKWLRAEYVVESNWHQLECAGNVACTGGPAGAGLVGRGFGDCASTGSGPSSATNAAGCNPGVYTSVGITQVKEQSCCHPGTFPLAWKSTAFNIDYQASLLRYYFDGLCGWCSFAYKGQEWPSIGAWFSPGSNDSGAVDYQNKVKTVLAEERWAKAGF